MPDGLAIHHAAASSLSSQDLLDQPRGLSWSSVIVNGTDDLHAQIQPTLKQLSNLNSQTSNLNSQKTQTHPIRKSQAYNPTTSKHRT